MHAELVIVGTELLLGELVDTNASFLATSLRDIGLDVLYKTTVGDNEARITQVINIALDRSDIVITSGGLGPTLDDVTRPAIAKATGRKLVYSIELERQIAEKFRSFGKKMSENNKRQAFIPEGATPLPNPAGTAPCFLSEDISGRGIVIALPGVPRELQYMMKNKVIPVLAERMAGARFTRIKILRTCAVGESNVDRAISDLMRSKNPTIGLAAHAGQTDVRITAKGTTAAEADTMIASMEREIRQRLGVAVYGTGRETLVEVVGRLLSAKGLKLGILDAVTRGLLGRELAEAGFADLLSRNLCFPDIRAALQGLELSPPDPADLQGPGEILTQAARSIAPPSGVGLALLGPFGNNSTFVAVSGPGSLRIFRQVRPYKDSNYFRRWIIVQGLDWVRRAVLGELESPAD
ncbi:MAG: CinA family nicotinamide mononucleotide deamidase-related protein [Deltaproteobacteria bacterium]|nr:CinA family nicotinamide mononucleotide deamidase-related protein [Deltaproteobacteria bacterium]